MENDDVRPGGLPMNEAPAGLRHSVGIPDATWTVDEIVVLLRQRDEQRTITAKRGQFNRWKKLGAFTAPGRGRQGRYSGDDVWRAAALNELSLLGVQPEKAVKTVKELTADSLRFGDFVSVLSPASASSIRLVLCDYRTAIEQPCEDPYPTPNTEPHNG